MGRFLQLAIGWELCLLIDRPGISCQKKAEVYFLLGLNSLEAELAWCPRRRRFLLCFSSVLTHMACVTEVASLSKAATEVPQPFARTVYVILFI